MCVFIEYEALCTCRLSRRVMSHFKYYLKNLARFLWFFFFNILHYYIISTISSDENHINESLGTYMAYALPYA